MHISIAGVEELTDPKSNLRYNAYLVHINGTFHCAVRFSQLHTLHEKLKREYGAGCLEKFPPKAFFYKKPEECLERRYYLQKWLQRIAQQPLIVNGLIFQTFLLNAQKEVQRGPEEDVELEVYLANGKKVSINIVSTDQTEDVLETVCSFIELPSDLTYFFGLYLVDDLDGKVIIRKLQDFESPFISLMRAEPHQKIQLRKAYFNIQYDARLIKDPTALNLLYIETIADIKNGFIKPSTEAQAQLDDLRSKRERAAYLQLASKQPGYGYRNFGEATSNWPEDNAKVIVTLGNPGNGAAAIILQDKTDKTEHTFYVQRMRCWRTYTVEEGVEMEFEYLVEAEGDKQKMEWIKTLSPQTIHTAMCLQFLVEEMVRENNRKPFKKPSDREGKFKPRRQSNAPPDMSFLTSDGNGNNEKQEDGQPSFRISVTLSDLMAKVKADEAEEYETADVTIEQVAANGFNSALDLEDGDDDPRANFAAMAGL
eukprot:TRINITY_DN7675_c0_g1_i1.p2 TRINITY_DN7675_c0_g1~~TRINITY_DN7675_c0_g1_i1.p2  ORF type:complete len:482 (+),score=173.85 TRINITY_DN7675_c0_g1_i1:3565-5010(+)